MTSLQRVTGNLLSGSDKVCTLVPRTYSSDDKRMHVLSAMKHSRSWLKSASSAGPEDSVCYLPTDTQKSEADVNFTSLHAMVSRTSSLIARSLFSASPDSLPEWVLLPTYSQGQANRASVSENNITQRRTNLTSCFIGNNAIYRVL